MTPQELKNSILQLAIQGKLVEQRPEEGTAEELFAQIQEEKRRLIKAGKIKKEKPLPEITEEEKSFEIPESWMWVRLRNIVFSRGQLTPQYTFSYIDIGSIDNRRQSLNANENIIEADKAPSRARKIVEQGDILYSTVRPYLHNMCIVDKQFSHTPIASTGFAVLTCYSGIFNKYLFYYLMAPAFDDYANSSENAKGVAYPAINDDRFYRAVIALPPLAEQKRIVAKIEELLPYIDRYEQAWSRLERFNSHFPEDMKKSLLQYAIQGKLVEQRPEEGTAQELFAQIQAEKQRLIQEGKINKQKPLPPITDDEKPFEIPESWMWVRFGDLVNIVSARRVHQADWKTNGIPFYRAREIAKLSDYGFVDNELFISEELYEDFSKSGLPHPGDLMVTAVGTLGKCYIVREGDEFYYKDASVICLENYAHLLPTYLKLIMQSEMLMRQIRSNSSGTTVATLTMVRMAQYLLPLPPLTEQKRIVEKLEQLLPLCERLK